MRWLWATCTLWLLFAVTFIEGTLFVFFNQAESNCLVRVVSKEQLGAAVAQNEAIYGVSGLIGPSLGGLLYGLGRGVPFLTDAVSYALSVAALLTLKTDVRPAPRAGRPRSRTWARRSGKACAGCTRTASSALSPC